MANENAPSKIINRINIALVGYSGAFSRAKLERLREIQNLLTTNPIYRDYGGLQLLKTLDKKTYREFTRLQAQEQRALALGARRPPTTVLTSRGGTRTSVTRGFVELQRTSFRG